MQEISSVDLRKNVINLVQFQSKLEFDGATTITNVVHLIC